MASATPSILTSLNCVQVLRLRGDGLELRDLAKLAIVEDKDHDTEVVRGGGQQFHACHEERLVPHDGRDLPLGMCELSADGGGHAVAHAVEVRRRDEAARAVDRKELGGEERVLAVVDHQLRVAVGKRVLRGGHGGGAEADARVQRMMGRHRALALERRGDGGDELLSETRRFVGCVHCAPAHVEARMVGAGE